MATEFDEVLLGMEEPGWRRRLLPLMLLALLTIGAVAGYGTFFTSEEAAETPVQTATVTRGGVSVSVSLTGVVAAESTSQLNFEQTGTVAKVNVTLGQEVKTGDVLAELDSVTARDAVRQAELNLQAASIRLTELQRPPTMAEKSAADESVQRAEAALSAANEDLRKLQAGPTASERSAAIQAVTSAQSALSQAQSAREKLNNTSSTERSSLEAAVRQAETALRTAENAVATAENSLTTSKASLFSAQTGFCPDSSVSFCSTRATPITVADEQALLTTSGGSSPEKATKATAVLQANAAYKNAVNARTSAQAGVDAARRDLATAQQKLTTTSSGPTASEIAAADASLRSAQQGLLTAQQKLAELDRPDAAKLQAAQSAVQSATSGLASAKAKRDETYAGAKQSDIDLQRNSVALSQLALEKARADLDKTKLVAPFDGTVADLKLQVGEQGGGGGSGGSGGSGSSSAAITLNTPKALRLDLTVGESDFNKIKPGQRGFVSISGLDGASYPIEIESVGTLPSTNSGVVTYAARARLLLETAAVVPQSGQAAPGAVTPAGEQPAATQVQPGVPAPATQGSVPGGVLSVPPSAGAPSATFRGIGQASGASGGKPAPGMQGQVTVITDSKFGVLTVPQGAISREGFDSVVKVQKDDGSQETVKVKTGLSNGQMVEVTEGVAEGQKVVLPGVTGTGSSGAGQQGAGGPIIFGPAQGVPAGGPGGGGGQIITIGPGGAAPGGVR